MYTYNTLYTGYKLQVTTKQQSNISKKYIQKRFYAHTYIHDHFFIIYIIFYYYYVQVCKSKYLFYSFIMLEPGLGVVPV